MAINTWYELHATPNDWNNTHNVPPPNPPYTRDILHVLVLGSPLLLQKRASLYRTYNLARPN